MKKIIFHIDVNSAYLSWSAIWNLQHGSDVDLRTIPSIVGGDPENRHGIVLAKSSPAKKYGIVTGETLFSALSKCPNLKIVKPRYSIYIKASDSMVKIFEQYSPIIERYSVDECFLDMGQISRKKASIKAKEIKDRIENELGFTVNIGIGENKLCAKMASDFKKPNMIHTLYPEEIKDKMWPLPIEDLFMVGQQFSKKLRNINIKTIGDIANTNPKYLENHFKKYGIMIYNFSNGIDESIVHKDGTVAAKGLGNSTTLPFDVLDKNSCYDTIYSLLETLVKRLKESGKNTSCICVYYTSNKFITRRKQKTFSIPTDSKNFIKKQCIMLFNDIYKNEAVRKIGISFSSLSSNNIKQLSFLDYQEEIKNENLNTVIDSIRNKFGNTSIVKGNFVNSQIDSFCGGVNDGDYVFMNSRL